MLRQWSHVDLDPDMQVREEVKGVCWAGFDETTLTLKPVGKDGKEILAKSQ